MRALGRGIGLLVPMVLGCTSDAFVDDTGDAGGTAGVHDAAEAGSAGSAADAAPAADVREACASGSSWCEGSVAWSCSEVDGPAVVEDCAASGKECVAGACADVCEPGLADCDCLPDTTCNAGLECIEDRCRPAGVPPPIAHWEFEGNLLDSSGNGYHGEEHGVITYYVGSDGVGADFSEGYARADTFAEPFRSVLGAFSLTLRFRADSYDRYAPLFGLSGDDDTFATNKWLILTCSEVSCVGTSAAGVIVETETGDAGDNSYQLLGPLPPVGQWVHLSVVVNADRIAMYVDGELLSTSFYVPAETSTSQLYLGGIGSTINSFDGVVDDIAVYDVELSGVQVAAVAAAYMRGP